MKKILMTLAAALCCAMTTTVFTACSSDDDDDSTKTFSYTIYFEPGTYAWQSGSADFSQWMNSILSAYKTALGVSGETFSKTGKEADCNKAVQDGCKNAESTVATIKGGSATVMVKNNTTGKTVYTYQVRP